MIMRTIKSKLLLVVVVPVVFLTLCSLAIFVICDIYQINTVGYRSAVSFAHISTKNIDSWLKINLTSRVYFLSTRIFLKNYSSSNH